MACQFNSSETAALDALDPFVQDALDLIAFANGPVENRWGKLRAQMGHPAPFNLKMIGIGNEQWGPQYVERYKRFADGAEEGASRDRAGCRAPGPAQRARSSSISGRTCGS